RDSVPQYAQKLFYDMQLQGLVPVIVHRERNRELLQQPETRYELIMNGALSQVPAASLIGKVGKQIAQYSEDLIDENLTHIVATDAHNTTTSPFHLKEAYEHVRKEFGVETYFQLLENSELLIDNMNVNRMEPIIPQKRRKKLFGLF